MIVALGSALQLRDRAAVIHEALNRSIGGVGWIVTPSDPSSPWNVGGSRWELVVDNALALANEIGAYEADGMTFYRWEIEKALVDRGYLSNLYDPSPVTTIAPPLAPGVEPISPPIRTIVAPATLWPEDIPPISAQPGIFLPTVPSVPQDQRSGSEALLYLAAGIGIAALLAA